MASSLTWRLRIAGFFARAGAYVMAIIVVLSAFVYLWFLLFGGGKLAFVAPPPWVMTVVVDGVSHSVVPGRVETIDVKRGRHVVVTTANHETLTWNVSVGRAEVLFVPAAEGQCFALLDATKSYTDAGGVQRRTSSVPPMLLGRITPQQPSRLPRAFADDFVVDDLPGQRHHDQKTYLLRTMTCETLEQDDASLVQTALAGVP